MIIKKSAEIIEGTVAYWMQILSLTLPGIFIDWMAGRIHFSKQVDCYFLFLDRGRPFWHMIYDVWIKNTIWNGYDYISTICISDCLIGRSTYHIDMSLWQTMPLCDLATWMQNGFADCFIWYFGAFILHWLFNEFDCRCRDLNTIRCLSRSLISMTPGLREYGSYNVHSCSLVFLQVYSSLKPGVTGPFFVRNLFLTMTK